MEADLGRSIPVLRRQYLFQGLDTAQLARVAGFFEQVEIGPGAVVFAEGHVPDYFYVVLDGKVHVTRKERKIERLLNILGPGDFFGEQALIFDDPRSATVVAVGPGPTALLRLSRARFVVLLKEYPEIRANLLATARSRKRARNIRFDWVSPEEVIYYISGRHIVFLWVALIGPVLLMVPSLTFLVYKTVAAGGAIMGDFLAVVLVIILFGSSLWALWSWLDWSNDFYMVTNQRVVWVEKIIFFYDSRREAPLNAVLAVNVTSSQLGRIINYGSVDVRTFTGSILMRQMEEPYRFAAFVDGLKHVVIALSKEQEMKDISDALETALVEKVAPPEIVPAEAPPPPPPPMGPPPKKKKDSFEWLRTFLKVRYQEGNTITYRKHWFILVSKAGVPFLVLFVLCPLTAWLTYKQVFTFFLLIPAALILLAFFIWLAYQYADWSNDIYRLTPDQILDVERKPLGRETKKTAGLDSPDFRVEHIRKNIVEILFDYGTVTINVGQTQFVFFNVNNPDEVHKDVAEYRQALLQRKLDEEEKRERERMVNWLVVYYQQTEKLGQDENQAGKSEVSG